MPDRNATIGNMTPQMRISDMCLLQYSSLVRANLLTEAASCTKVLRTRTPDSDSWATSLREENPSWTFRNFGPMALPKKTMKRVMKGSGQIVRIASPESWLRRMITIAVVMNRPSTSAVSAQPVDMRIDLMSLVNRAIRSPIFCPP